MGIIFTAKELSKTYDSRPLFSNLNFGIEAGGRIGLIGPNGAGKSTLLKIISGKITPDEGELVFQRGIRVAHLEQLPIFKEQTTVLQTLMEASQFHEEWEGMAKADELLWKLDFEEAGIHADTVVETLSGGWKKRLALGRELMREPDLLLMDEPTNHLDIESILWLEDLISTASFATLTITHDRLFLQRASNRILELDRRNPGGLLSVKGNYTTYIEVKEALMTAQENRETILRGNLRRETEWLRAGAKARTTKQQARISRHGELSEEVSELAARNIKRVAQLEFQSADNAPKRLIDAKKISKSFSKDRLLFSNLDLLITPGSRLGILGANGCGKSTLIRVLLGLEKPDHGHIKHSDQLRVAYFEQNRESLDPKTSLLRTVCPYGDHVNFQGRQIHIRSYLDRFLFSQAQMDLPISALSGGEQSRVLIAKLMLEEANVLVLDEPTNDLDIATLNVLQDCLQTFEGAVLLVSHDRYFLDQVSNNILAFPITEEEMKIGKLHFFADLPQWESWHQKEQKRRREATKMGANAVNEPIQVPLTSKNKSPENKKELDQLAKKIEKAESSLAKLESECADPKIATDLKKLNELGLKMKTIQDEIEGLYKKWQELEA